MKKFLIFICLPLLLIAAIYSASKFNIGDKREVELQSNFQEGDKINQGPSIEEIIIGVWQSTEDPRFTREFKKDGSAIDKYDNGDSYDQTMLSWNIFSSKDKEPDFPYPYDDNVSYVRMSNGRDDLYFKVANITSGELQLVYLDRGGGLKFVRKD